MTATPPGKIKLPPGPSPADVFDMSTDSASPSPYSTVPMPKGHRRSIRPSFSTVGRGTRRGSMATALEEDVPKLPTLVPGIRPAYSTPLPMLPMIVLCIVG